MSETPNPTLPEPNPVTESGGLQYEKFLDCVHCGLCTSACPTYLETGNENDSPRGRIYLMRAVTDGRIELTDKVSRHLDLCLDCRSCETACPSGVEYGRLIEPFRVKMHQQPDGQPAKPDWFHRWIMYGIFPYANRIRWTLVPARIMQALKLDLLMEATGLTKLLPQKLQRMQRLLPQLQPRGPELPEFLPAIGEKRATVALFTGCVSDAMFHHVNWTTARVLQQNGCDVHIPKSQGCCGAIHYHSGQGDPAMQLANQNEQAFNIDNIDAVIVNVAGCGSMLKDYGHIASELTGQAESNSKLSVFATKVKDVSEFLSDLGAIAPQHPIEMKATYHDACHLCHAQQIRTQPRQLLNMIPGLELTPLAESEICCGAAGSYNLTEPEMADRLGDRKVENILATGAESVIMGNVGCSLQIQSVLKSKDRADVKVLHPIELLDMSYQGTGLAEKS
ncbi:heterodisulfide reductase-related iron-sulfur binding cluster [Planctomicrobium sp.]|jgi:glycolate oxidase iron-sulfur subunit|nr:heterodisulfide reductase-related iron-sulfur binding cluster [Planctomicrobium sp.]MBT5017780.1 4Fe-4S dicluster domain-containing protein [Planctomicrobium sp.]MDA7503634.1 heterodisulfide reductase-related iron-sulfur binding cluster [bacterium]MDB4743307.1 heterodisulfide reductase-related iron-sulfur binding cluster [Planctomicrobium sp.]